MVTETRAKQQTELIFLVEEAPEGGFVARALGASIFTEADTLEQLHANVRDAVNCHYEPGEQPKLIRLHFVREEVLKP
jgi:hypothetical protein